MPVGNYKFEKVQKELLIRYFENKVTEKEASMVSSWLVDPQNREAVLEYIESRWQEGGFKDAQSASFETVFRKAEEGQGSASRRVPLRRRWLWPASAAACVLLLAAGTWMGYHMKRSAEPSGEWILSTASTGKGQRTQLLLSDGSEVYLNAETKLTLPKKRDVQQVMYLEGEAYFNLKNTGRPVTIKTKEITTVAGSSRINISAFPKDSTVTVSVEKGKAEISGNTETWPMMKLRIVRNDSIAQQEKSGAEPKVMPLIKLLPPLMVRENQAMIFDKGSGSAGVVRRMNDEQYAAWKDGIISFTNADSSEIVHKLERWFGIKVYLSATELRPYNAEFKNASLKEVLQHLSESLHLACKIKGDAVYMTQQK